MKNLPVLILIGILCFAGCDTGDGTSKGEKEPPFTGPTTIAAVDSYLAGASGGQSPTNPVELAVKISASEWKQLYQTIGGRDKFVALDLSRCYDVPEAYSGRGVFGTANDKIVSLILPEGITSIAYTIPYGAFVGYTNFKYITLPQSLTEIGQGAFSGCTGLTEIDLPANLTRIRPSAFNDCTGLTRVICRATTPPTGGISMFYGVGCNIEVPSGSVQQYKNASFWSDYASKIVSM